MEVNTHGGTAERMASNQKQVAISVFEKQALPRVRFFDPFLITAVKKPLTIRWTLAKARILPDMRVKITKIDDKKNIVELQTEDNGPKFQNEASRRCSGNCCLDPASMPFANLAASKASASPAWSCTVN